VDKQILAIFVQEAGKIATGLLSLRTPKLKEEPRKTAEPKPEPEPVIAQVSVEASPERTEEEQIQTGVACLPCTNSHLLTCRGLLDEAHRMSHDGLTPDGMERVDQCLGEIAAAERIDLAPANIVELPKGEQDIAHYAARELRNIRHDLEGLTSPIVLEQAAAKVTEVQKRISREFFNYRLAKMSPEEKGELRQKIQDKLKEDGDVLE